MTPGCALCAPVKGGCPALLEPGDRQPSPGARGGSTGGDGPPLPGVPPGTEPGWVLGSHASSPRGRAHILSKPWQGGRAAHPPPRSLPPTAHPAGSGRSPHHAPPAGPEPRGHASSWPGQHGPCSTALSARAGGGAQALGSQRPSRWPHPSPGRPSPPPDVGCVIAAPPPPLCPHGQPPVTKGGLRLAQDTPSPLPGRLLASGATAGGSRRTDAPLARPSRGPRPTGTQARRRAAPGVVTAGPPWRPGSGAPGLVGLVDTGQRGGGRPWAQAGTRGTLGGQDSGPAAAGAEAP